MDAWLRKVPPKGALTRPARAAHWRRWVLWLWASPNTLVGLLGIALWWCAGAQVCWVGGALEAALPASKRKRARRRHLPFAAITLGHVVMAATAEDMERWRAHERVHVQQYERLGAPVSACLPVGWGMAMVLPTQSLLGQPVRGGGAARRGRVMGVAPDSQETVRNQQPKSVVQRLQAVGIVKRTHTDRQKAAIVYSNGAGLSGHCMGFPKFLGPIP